MDFPNNNNDISEAYLKTVLLHRKNDTHKRDYGHALLVCGCRRMPGAAVLATGGALRSGCGLVTLHTVSNAGTAVAGRFPSAILSLEEGECFATVPEGLSKYACIGIGPGLGTHGCTAEALEAILKEAGGTPFVLDADALNIIAADPQLLGLVPEGSVMTPHGGELKRLIHEWEEGREDLLMDFCRNTGIVLVKKGYRTRIFTPEGDVFVNTTGNPGMAKGGSGDVLTGLVTGLVARGYDTLTAAMLGVWIHGYAGDCLTRECTAEAYDSADLIEKLKEGFVKLYI